MSGMKVECWSHVGRLVTELGVLQVTNVIKYIPEPKSTIIKEVLPSKAL